MTLLEKAKAAAKHRKARHDANPEKLELAIAYASGKINSSQAREALGSSSVPGAYQGMASAILGAIRRGEYRLVKAERVEVVDADPK